MAKTTKAEILAVARDLMRDRGFSGTSIKDIADRVGLQKASLYSHFPSKTALLPDMLALARDELLDGIDATGDWLADYRRALDKLVERLSHQQRCLGFHLAYGLDIEDGEGREAVRRFFVDIEARLVAILSQGIEPQAAQALARETLTALEGATLWLALDGDGEPMAAARDALDARAQAETVDVDHPAARAMLDQMMGDWRQASATERRLAVQLAALEGDFMTVDLTP